MRTLTLCYHARRKRGIMSAPGNDRKADKDTTRSDWGTPRYIFEYYRERYGFEVDAAASAGWSMCNDFMDETYDSLRNPWRPGKSHFLNPPYGGLDMGRWIQQNIDQARSDMGIRGGLLVPNATETKWFETAFNAAMNLHIIAPRIPFIHPVTRLPVANNPGGSVLFWITEYARPGGPKVFYDRIPEPKGNRPNQRR